ncbi:CatA-like O-acetyltransferase [Inhella sp.]|uniref:CatA-like O-acetyltransferase n=1 Tax=Inhella sp. TaxID=1921806 RepID=UPI0035B2B0C7
MVTPVAIDPGAGPRAQAYAFYRAAKQPRWGFTTRLDVGPLLRAVRIWQEDCPDLTPMLAYHHALLQATLAVPALRQRLTPEGGAVEWPSLDASITLVRDDDSFAIAYLPWAPKLRDFVAPARAAMAAARQPGTDWGLGQAHRGCLYTTTLPWLDFTHFEHAHTAAFDEGTPRVAFGRFCPVDDARTEMAFNLEIHHALVDGVHAGRLVQALEALLAEPGQLW